MCKPCEGGMPFVLTYPKFTNIKKKLMAGISVKNINEIYLIKKKNFFLKTFEESQKFVNESW